MFLTTDFVEIRRRIPVGIGLYPVSNQHIIKILNMFPSTDFVEIRR